MSFLNASTSHCSTDGQDIWASHSAIFTRDVERPQSYNLPCLSSLPLQWNQQRKPTKKGQACLLFFFQRKVKRTYRRFEKKRSARYWFKLHFNLNLLIASQGLFEAPGSPAELSSLLLRWPRICLNEVLSQSCLEAKWKFCYYLAHATNWIWCRECLHSNPPKGFECPKGSNFTLSFICSCGVSRRGGNECFYLTWHILSTSHCSTQ